MYLLRQTANSENSLDFNQYAERFFSDEKPPEKEDKDEKESKRPKKKRKVSYEKQTASINASFGFTIIILRELKHLNNGALLTNSLE